MVFKKTGLNEDIKLTVNGVEAIITDWSVNYDMPASTYYTVGSAYTHYIPSPYETTVTVKATMPIGGLSAAQQEEVVDEEEIVVDYYAGLRAAMLAAVEAKFESAHLTHPSATMLRATWMTGLSQMQYLKHVNDEEIAFAPSPDIVIEVARKEVEAVACEDIGERFVGLLDAEPKKFWTGGEGYIASKGEAETWSQWKVDDYKSNFSLPWSDPNPDPIADVHKYGIGKKKMWDSSNQPGFGNQDDKVSDSSEDDEDF